jgi:hypothetical protein
MRIQIIKVNTKLIRKEYGGIIFKITTTMRVMMFFRKGGMMIMMSNTRVGMSNNNPINNMNMIKIGDSAQIKRD